MTVERGALRVKHIKEMRGEKREEKIKYIFKTPPLSSLFSFLQYARRSTLNSLRDMEKPC